ncbi:MAG: DnaB-like helicase N-terminal domain-containing protein [Chryseolinea sp.]
MSEPLRLPATPDQFDKLPPHSIEAEQCLLASLMLDKELVGQAAPMIVPDAFYLADHQIIYTIILHLYEANRPIDAVILREELLKRGQLEEIGGTAYLAEVLNTVPSAANGLHYAQIVRDKFLLRQLISVSNDAIREAYAPHESVDVIIDRAEKRVFDIADKKISSAMTALGDIAMQVYELLEGEGRRGLPTGFYELDDMLNGLQGGEMIIVAARPSMGKAQPLDSRVLTAAGFKPMGDLRVGDALASVDGATSFVTGIFPQGERQVYRLTFADGRSTECCAEHLWRVHFRQWEKPRVLTTAQDHGDAVAQTLSQSSLDRDILRRIRIRRGASDRPLAARRPHRRRFARGFVAPLLDRRAELLEKVQSSIGASMTVSHAGAYDYRIVQKSGGKQAGVQGAVANPLTAALRQLGLWDKNAEQKFIPGCYLTAQRESRCASRRPARHRRMGRIVRRDPLRHLQPATRQGRRRSRPLTRRQRLVLPEKDNVHAPRRKEVRTALLRLQHPVRRRFIARTAQSQARPADSQTAHAPAPAQHPVHHADARYADAVHRGKPSGSSLRHGRLCRDPQHRICNESRRSDGGCGACVRGVLIGNEQAAVGTAHDVLACPDRCAGASARGC